jgi:hypothetical protein
MGKEYDPEQDALFGLRSKIRTSHRDAVGKREWMAWIYEKDQPIGFGSTEADAIDDLRVQLEMEGK